MFVPPPTRSYCHLHGLDEEGVEPADRMSLAKLAATRQHEHGLRHFFHQYITEESIFQEMNNAISVAEVVRIEIETLTARGEPITLETILKEFGSQES